MIYYYLVKIRYVKGKEYILREYRLSFLEIGQFFKKLQEKHKDNYTLVFIKPLKYINGYQRVVKT